MKLLLDEQLDVQLKSLLSGIEVYTPRDLGWLGLQNGELRRNINEKGFQFFVTADKNFPFQQNFSKINFTILLFDTPSMRWRHQQLFISPIQKFLDNLPSQLPKLVHISIVGISLGKKRDALQKRLPPDDVLFLEFPSEK